MTDREELQHLINHTELVPSIVEELAEAVKKVIPSGFRAETYPGLSSNQIRIISLSPKLDNAKSREVASININVNQAIIIASAWGIKDSEDKSAGFIARLTVEFQDPACFDKIEAWVGKFNAIKFWYDR